LGNVFRNDGLVIPIALHNDHWFLIKPCPVRPFPDWWFSVRPTLPEQQHLIGRFLPHPTGKGHTHHICTPQPTRFQNHLTVDDIATTACETTQHIHEPSSYHHGMTSIHNTPPAYKGQGCLPPPQLVQVSVDQLIQVATKPHQTSTLWQQLGSTGGFDRPPLPNPAMPCCRCGGTHPIGQKCQTKHKGSTNTSHSQNRRKDGAHHQGQSWGWPASSSSGTRWRRLCRQCHIEWKEQDLLSCMQCAPR
jgi:hypothetical protein